MENVNITITFCIFKLVSTLECLIEGCLEYGGRWWWKILQEWGWNKRGGEGGDWKILENVIAGMGYLKI